MASTKAVHEALAQVPELLPHGATALFIGATSGIGRSALTQFARASKDKSPRIYVVGRSASRAADIIAELRQLNTSAQVEFIGQDVSLVRSIDAMASTIANREEKLDFLYISAGYIPFEGRIG
jgi:NAD(P)-dependent dehydrogenase (short-subunit alcohol dehydrogenase family)